MNPIDHDILVQRDIHVLADWLAPWDILHLHRHAPWGGLAVAYLMALVTSYPPWVTTTCWPIIIFCHDGWLDLAGHERERIPWATHPKDLSFRTCGGLYLSNAAYGCSPEVESRALAAITTYGYSPEVESRALIATHRLY